MKMFVLWSVEFLYHLFSAIYCFQDGMVTMHDVLDAQWMLDNHRDGEKTDFSDFFYEEREVDNLFYCRELHEKSCETTGGSTDITQKDCRERQRSEFRRTLLRVKQQFISLSSFASLQVNAVCYGAKVLLPGVLRFDEGIEPNMEIVIMTTKGEAVALGNNTGLLT